MPCLKIGHCNNNSTHLSQVACHCEIKQTVVFISKNSINTENLNQGSGEIYR